MQLLPIDIENELSGEKALRFAENLPKVPLHDVDGVILQFTNESNLDVNGVAVLVRIYSRLQSMNKRLYVTGVSVAVARALTRLGLASILNVPEVPKRPPLETDPSLSVLSTKSLPAVPPDKVKADTT